MAYDRFDIVRVPFPFADSHSTKHRPALVVSDAGRFNTAIGHSVMAMITSAGHSPWPLDYRIAELGAAGLPLPSIIRFKLFTLDHRLVRGVLGQLASVDATAVTVRLQTLFALADRTE